MAQQRQFEIGGVYHVFNRGVDKRTIFQKDQDYTRFLLGLYYYNRQDIGPSIWTNINNSPKKAFAPLSANIAMRGIAMLAEKPLVRVLAFCLMKNHYHLILKPVVENGVENFMHKMGGYSRYFNKQYERSGVLFQGPYKAVQVKNDSQLNTLFAYVHTNPIEIIEPGWKKEKQVKDYKKAIKYLNSYKWSSYHDYTGTPTFPKITNKEFFIKHFGSEKDCKDAVLDWIKFKAENYDISFVADK